MIASRQRFGLTKSNKARLRALLAPIDTHVDQMEWSRFKAWTEGSSRLDEARILFRIQPGDFLYYLQGGDDKEKGVS